MDKVLDQQQQGNSDVESPWIESDFHKGDDENKYEARFGITDLFADPDPYETFEFHFEPNIDIILVGYKAENGQTLNSTGLTLWRASNLLCDYLMANPESVRGKLVLELGAGLGLCGILSYYLHAAKVLLTDADTDTLANMRTNVNRNCCTYRENGAKTHCKQFVWGRDLAAFMEQNGRNFDTILGSDIIYAEETIEPIFCSVSQLLSPTGQFLLAYTRRNVKIDLVFQEAAKHGFVWMTPKDAEGVFVFFREKSKNK
jgi:predicted nicotinamide N-methyase